MKSTKFVITVAIIITILNHVVGPIFLDMETESTATGVAIILLAIAQLNQIRENK